MLFKYKFSTLFNFLFWKVKIPVPKSIFKFYLISLGNFLDFRWFYLSGSNSRFSYFYGFFSFFHSIPEHLPVEMSIFRQKERNIDKSQLICNWMQENDEAAHAQRGIQLKLPRRRTRSILEKLWKDALECWIILKIQKVMQIV